MQGRPFLPTIVLLSSVLVAPGLVRAKTLDSPDEQRQFLVSADIISWEQLPSGITGAWRLTLSDGTSIHDAVFQSVDTSHRASGARSASPSDSYRHSLAAYRLAELVGLSDMMPMTVERTWRGTRGALIWWIDDVIYDEETRLNERRWPPDLDEWGRQIDRMWIFAELVHDTDRHGGNLLYSGDWKLHMIDFTRAFSLAEKMLKPYRLQRADRALLARLAALTTESVTMATAPYLNHAQIAATLRRRDTLIERLRATTPND